MIDYLAMIEDATYDDCERLAESYDDLTADDLYGFVIGDNDNELCFKAFKDDIDEAALNHEMYRRGM